MKKLIILFMVCMAVINSHCLAQNDGSPSSKVEAYESYIKEDSIPKDVFLMSTSKPFFPGGRQAMINFISENLHYPDSAIKYKIEGKVILKFIIDSLGKICCIDVIGQRIGYGLEEEAIRIVRSMPNWNPAYMDEKRVAVYYRLPINFKYFEEEK